MQQNTERSTARSGRNSSLLTQIGESLVLLGNYLAGYASALRMMSGQNKPGGPTAA